MTGFQSMDSTGPIAERTSLKIEGALDDENFGETPP